MNSSVIEQLSSSRTFWYKLVFPILWVSGFGLGTLAMFAGWYDHSSPQDLNTRLTFLLVWVVGSSFIIWLAHRLKTVAVARDHLLVGNYQKEIEIPLSSIIRVSETHLVNPKQIVLRLYPACEFGDKIVFIPKVRFYNPFGDHPAVTRLRRLSLVNKRLLPNIGFSGSGMPPR
jgi:hypothetical protein